VFICLPRDRDVYITAGYWRQRWRSSCDRLGWHFYRHCRRSRRHGYRTAAAAAGKSVKHLINPPRSLRYVRVHNNLEKSSVYWHTWTENVISRSTVLQLGALFVCFKIHLYCLRYGAVVCLRGLCVTLHWLPVHDRIKFKIATTTHKATYTGNSLPPVFG